MLHHILLLSLSSTVVVLRCENIVIARQTNEKVANTQGEGKVVTNTAGGNVVVPSTNGRDAFSTWNRQTIPPRVAAGLREGEADVFHRTRKSINRRRGRNLVKIFQ